MPITAAFTLNVKDPLPKVWSVLKWCFSVIILQVPKTTPNSFYALDKMVDFSSLADKFCRLSDILSLLSSRCRLKFADASDRLQFRLRYTQTFPEGNERSPWSKNLLLWYHPKQRPDFFAEAACRSTHACTPTPLGNSSTIRELLGSADPAQLKPLN